MSRDITADNVASAVNYVANAIRHWKANFKITGVSLAITGAVEVRIESDLSLTGAFIALTPAEFKHGVAEIKAEHFIYNAIKYESMRERRGYDYMVQPN